MFSRFWKLRGFLDFRNLWCLKVEASMWMEKVRVNAVIFQHDSYPALMIKYHCPPKCRFSADIFMNKDKWQLGRIVLDLLYL
jgi:hypothetical protein